MKKAVEDVARQQQVTTKASVDAGTQDSMSLGESPENHAVEMSLHEEFGVHSVTWGETLGGFSSRNIVLTVQNQSYVLKQYSPTAARQIERLEAIALFLRKQNFLAPLPQPTRTGKLHFFCKNKTYALFLRHPGTIRHGNNLSEKHLRSAAEALAKLHLLQPNDIGLLGSARRPLHRDASALSQLLCEANGLARLAAKDIEVLKESLRIKSQIIAASDYEKCVFAERGNQFVHGDFHNENLLFARDASVSCVLDFEESFLGQGACDVINFFFLACCNDGLSSRQLADGRTFLKFYRAIITVEDSALEAAIDRHFLAMASSTFLEERLMEGQEFFSHLLRRDIDKMRVWQQKPRYILDAFA